eukprot:Nk52_evm21s316 gene=Nk52_evmTU21s316
MLIKVKKNGGLSSIRRDVSWWWWIRSRWVYSRVWEHHRLFNHKDSPANIVYLLPVKQPQRRTSASATVTSGDCGKKGRGTGREGEQEEQQTETLGEEADVVGEEKEKEKGGEEEGEGKVDLAMFNRSRAVVYEGRRLPILACTKWKLIEKVTSAHKAMAGCIHREFITDVVLTSSVYFKNQCEFIDLLICRYCGGDLQEKGSKEIVQARVCNVLKAWISIQPYDLLYSTALLDRFLLFTGIMRWCHPNGIMAYSLEKLLWRKVSDSLPLVPIQLCGEEYRGKLETEQDERSEIYRELLMKFGQKKDCLKDGCMGGIAHGENVRSTGETEDGCFQFPLSNRWLRNGSSTDNGDGEENGTDLHRNRKEERRGSKGKGKDKIQKRLWMMGGPYKKFYDAVVSLEKNSKCAKARAQFCSCACDILLNKIDSKCLAHHLALIDEKFFMAFTPRDFVRDKVTSSEANGQGLVKLKADWTNRLLDNFAAIIVFESNLKSRALLLRRFIKAGVHLLDLRDYDGVVQILAILRCASVRRLSTTWDYLRDKHSQVYEGYQELGRAMAQDGNFKVYRETLNQLEQKHLTNTDSQQRRSTSCIPFIGLFLSDLTFIEDGNSAVHQERIDRTRYLLNIIPISKPSKKSLINFHKFSQIASLVRKILMHQEHCQHPSLSNTNASSLDFIVGVTHGVFTDDDNYEQSLITQPRNPKRPSTLNTSP